MQSERYTGLRAQVHKEANRMRKQSKAEATERQNPQMSRWRQLAMVLDPSLLLRVLATGVASMIGLLFR